MRKTTCIVQSYVEPAMVPTAVENPEHKITKNKIIQYFIIILFLFVFQHNAYLIANL